MKKLLILLSIFFLLSNSNVNSAGRSDDAAAVAPAKKKQRIEKKESKEGAAAIVGRYLIDTPKDRKALEELIKLAALRVFPGGVLRVVLDYCKTQYESAHILNRHNNGHTNLITSLITLDEAHLVSSSYDMTIKIWQLIPGKTPKCIKTLDKYDDGNTIIVLSLMQLDETHFVSGSDDGTIKIWEFIPETSSTPAQCRCIQNLDQSNGGHAMWANGLIKLDETHFISCSLDKTIKIWQLIPETSIQPQYRCIHTYDRNNGHTDWATALIALDETHFASVSNTGTIKIWKFVPETASTLAQCRCIHTLDQDNGGYIDWFTALIALDETHFASGSNEGTIRIWQYDPSTDSVPEYIHTLNQNNSGHIRPVTLLTRLDETHFVSGSADGSMKIWELIPETSSTPATYKCIQTLITDIFTVTIARMPNGNLIAGLANGVIEIFQPVVDIE